jgi:uncharacterized membrane protein
VERRAFLQARPRDLPGVACIVFNRKTTHWLSHLEAHHRLALSLAFAAIVFLALQGQLLWRTRLIATWDAYALCLLGLAWTRIVTAQPRVVVRLATLQPSSRKLILIFVIVAACASLASVAYLLGMAKGLAGWKLGTHITLALVTIVLSWLVLHTVFTLHYAQMFYHEHRNAHPAQIARGLVFPDGEIEPDYLDFAYFAFIIGMTSQVSDVQINSRTIRRWALLHGMVAFAFNTTVLALGINIISGLF